MKSEIFKKELEFIKNKDIKEFTELSINNLPDYFFTVAASTTGKYHPKYALGDGGLVRHTKAAVKIASDLLNLDMYSIYSEREKDLIITAIILHDGYKLGDGKTGYTVFNHPIIGCDWVSNDKIFENKLPDTERKFIGKMIASHMGQWNTDSRSSLILEEPKTKEQKFVHMCDYLASRKYLEFVFEDESSTPFVTAKFDIETFTIPFGKYRGRLLKEIINEDSKYVTWLRDVKSENISKETQDYLDNLVL